MTSFKTILILILSYSVSFANDKAMDDKIAIAIEQQGPVPEIVPEGGFIPNSEIAIKIAEIVLKPIFKHEMKKQIPLRAHRNGDIWVIEGKEQKTKCNDKDKSCFRLDQSPIHMEIAVKDGRILKLYKYK